MKPRKPRTITGRVGARLREAVLGTTNPTAVNEMARMSTDLEYAYMLVVAQATRQGLEPADFDNDQGTDAFYAIFLVVGELDRKLIHVTPAWRRVVISARAKMRWPSRPRGWRHTRTSTDDLDLRTSS
jgi:hypothetical protein